MGMCMGMGLITTAIIKPKSRRNDIRSSHGLLTPFPLCRLSFSPLSFFLLRLPTITMSSLDKNDATNPLDEDAPGQPISVPDSGDTGESGKLKMIVQLVKKCLGVKDIASM